MAYDLKTSLNAVQAKPVRFALIKGSQKSMVLVGSGLASGPMVNAKAESGNGRQTASGVCMWERDILVFATSAGPDASVKSAITSALRGQNCSGFLPIQMRKIGDHEGETTTGGSPAVDGSSNGAATAGDAAAANNVAPTDGASTAATDGAAVPKPEETKTPENRIIRPNQLRETMDRMQPGALKAKAAVPARAAELDATGQRFEGFMTAGSLAEAKAELLKYGAAIREMAGPEAITGGKPVQPPTLSQQAVEILKGLKEITDPPGATAEDLTVLTLARKEVVAAINNTGLSTSQIDLAKAKLEAARQGVPQAVAAMETRLKKEADKVREELAALKNPADATEEELAGVNTAREAVTKALPAAGLTQTHIDDARSKLKPVEDAISVVSQAIQKRLGEEAQTVRKELDALVDPVYADTGELAPVKQARQTVTTLLDASPLKAADLVTARNGLAGVGEAIKKAAEVVAKRLQTQKDEVLTSLAQYKDPADAESAELNALNTAREVVKSALPAAGLKPDDITAAKNLLPAVKTALDEATAVVQKRLRTAADLLLADTAPGGKFGTNPPEALPAQIKALGDARTALGNKLKANPLTAALVTEGGKDLEAFGKLYSDTLSAIEDLGGAEGLKSLKAALGGGDKVDALQAAFAPADGKAFKKLIDDFGGQDSLKRLLTKFTPAKLQTVSNNVGGPQIVSALLNQGCGGKPEDLDKLLQAFGGNFARLKGVVEKGGVKSKPKSLAAMFKRGCGGKPARFKQFCDQFTTDAQLEGLDGLLNAGGLGDKPDCLGELLDPGLDDGNNAVTKAAKLQDFAAKTKAHLPKLKRMVGDDGGLGDNPAVLSGLMSVGCARDPEKFGKLLEGMSDVSLQQLNGVVGKGGVNAKPDILGHVFATGCAGDPAKLTTFCAQFATEEDQGKLNDLVTKGGFGGGPRGASDTLASVLKDAYPTAPGRLKDLHGAFLGGPPAGKDLPKLAETMDAFNTVPLPPPPPPATPVPPLSASRAGERLARVNKFFPPPPETVAQNLKNVFYTRLDVRNAGDAGRIVRRGVADDTGLARASQAAASLSAPDANTTAGMNTASAVATMAVMLSTDPGKAADMAQVQRAGLAAGDGTTAAASVATLKLNRAALLQQAKDRARDQGTATAAPAAGDQPPTTEAVNAAVKIAGDTVNNAANAAATKADQARAALNPADVATIEACAKAAAEAAAAAIAANDPAAVTKAENAAVAAGLAAVQASRAFANGKVGTVLSGHATAARTSAKTAMLSQQACNYRQGLAADAEKTAWIKDRDPGATANAKNFARADATNKRAAVNTGPRDAAMRAAQADAKRARDAALATAVLADPAALRAQADAATARAKGGPRPVATDADRKKALDAELSAATAVRAAASSSATTAVNNVLGINLNDLVNYGPGADMSLYQEVQTASSAASAASAAAQDELAQAEQALRAAETAVALAQKRKDAATARAAAVGNDTADTTELANANSALTAATNARNQAVTTRANAKTAQTGAQNRLENLKFRAKDIADATYRATNWNPPLATNDQLQMASAVAGATVLDHHQASGAKPMTDLLRVASTCEKAALAGPHMMNMGGADQADTAHFCNRHTRKHFTFAQEELYREGEIVDCLMLDSQGGTGAGGGMTYAENGLLGVKRFNKITSLWPEGTTEADIQSYTLKAVTAKLPAYRYGTNSKFQGVSITDKDGKTIKVTIAFNPPDGRPYPDGSTDPYTVTQFYPEGMETMSFTDMHIVKEGLRALEELTPRFFPMQVTFEFDAPDQPRIPENLLAEAGDAAVKSIFGEIPYPMGGLNIAGDGRGSFTAIGDELLAMIGAICFDAVPELAAGRPVTYQYSSDPYEVRFLPREETVRVEGDNVTPAEYPRQELLRELTGCGERFLKLMQTAHADDPHWKNTLTRLSEGLAKARTDAPPLP